LSVTIAPPEKLAVHVAPQLIPAGTELTLPMPVSVTLTLYMPMSNCALTFAAAATVIVQTGIAMKVAQSPPQVVKVLPIAGTAVSCTICPSPNCAVQVAPQSMPLGTELTVPEPMPLFVTASG